MKELTTLNLEMVITPTSTVMAEKSCRKKQYNLTQGQDNYSKTIFRQSIYCVIIFIATFVTEISWQYKQ